MAKQILLTDNGVHREATDGYITVNGVYRKIKEGFITVDGVYRSFMSSGMPLTNLPVGTLIRTNVGGVPRNFGVAHQGLPSSMYDSSCDGTWLLMKDIYENRKWDGKDNDYANSDIHAYLNGSFLSLFDSGVQSIIKQVKIPYVPGTGATGTVASGDNGLSTKIFLPAFYEVGYTPSTGGVSGHIPNDSARLSYFSSGLHKDRVAYLNGKASDWWLRSPLVLDYAGGQNGIVYWVNSDGTSKSSFTSSKTSGGVRPAFILPSDALVNPTPNADGSYTLLA